MNSPYNPKMGDFLRAGGVELKCDGAAAAIVCATEMIPVIAGNLKHHPIEVLGIGSAACEATTPILKSGQPRKPSARHMS